MHYYNSWQEEVNVWESVKCITATVESLGKFIIYYSSIWRFMCVYNALM